jgi:hypothetical protein
MTKAPESEPPLCLRPPIFMVGQNSRGNWVVRDQSGLRGGLFVGRAEALRYVRFESGDRLTAIVMVSGAFELDTGGMKRTIAPQFKAEEQRERLVA